MAKKAQGGRATMQRRPFWPPQQGGSGAENEPPHPRAANAPQGADPGPSPVPAPPSEPNGSPVAGPLRPLLPSGGAACSGTLQVVLCNYSLWLTFHGQQNEMTLSRPGRPMFPFLAYQMRGLDPCARYRVFVDMVRVDGQHWRYEKARWAPYAPEESHVPGNQMYPHPDSPNTGAHWMQREVAFKKLKLTNAEPAARSAGRAIWLQSQHRYRPRLHVEELGGRDREAPAAASRTHVFSFPETEFIAVTAYRNAEIIRLKIAHNPYAAAFRRRFPVAGSSTVGPRPRPASTAPWAEVVCVPAGQRSLLPEGQARDLGSSTPGHGLQGPRPLSAWAAALPPSLLPPTNAASAPYQDRRQPPGSGMGEPGSLPPTSLGHRMDCLQSWLSQPLEPAPGAREQPRLHREICSQGTQTDAQDAARGERAPKKKRQCPSHSSRSAMSSARAHGQAQAQRLPAPEGSANASPEAASEDPGDLPVTEEAAVQEGDRAMPANYWALQQPQQPLYYVFDSTRSSSSSSSSNGLATLQAVTLNPDLQISPAPLAVSYGSNPESLLPLLQMPTFPAVSSQGTSGISHPSLPLHPVLGAQEQPSDQQQMWPHLTQTELEDSALTEGAPQKRSLSPQASGRQARCSGRDDRESQDQLLTSAASSPYTFSEAVSEDPGHLLGVRETPTPNNSSGLPVLSSAPQQSQPPLHSLFHSTPSSSNSRSLPSLEHVAMGASTSPLAMPYEPSPEEALFSILEASGCLSETSHGTSSDCLTSLPSRPMNSVPGGQEGQSLQEEIWPSLTETVLEDSPQAPRTSETAPFSHNDYSGQDTSFTIEDFYWDSF